MSIGKAGQIQTLIVTMAFQHALTKLAAQTWDSCHSFTATEQANWDALLTRCAQLSLAWALHGSSDACLGHADLHFWQAMCAPLLCSSCFHLWCSAGRMEGEQTGTCLLLCISIIDVTELPAVFRSWACVCHLLGYCQSAVYAVLCSSVIF